MPVGLEPVRDLTVRGPGDLTECMVALLSGSCRSISLM